MVDWGERLDALVSFSGVRSCTRPFLSLSCPFPPLSFPCLPSLPGQSSPKPKGGPQKVGSLTRQGGAREGGQWLQVRDGVGRGGCPQGWQLGTGEGTQNAHLWGWPIG